MTYLDLDGSVDATELEPGVFVVAAHGPTDERVAGELRRLLLPIAAADGSVVCLDLHDAHGIDGPALRVIAEAAHLVRMRGERLRIVTRCESTSALIAEHGLTDIVVVADAVQS